MLRVVSAFLAFAAVSPEAVNAQDYNGLAEKLHTVSARSVASLQKADARITLDIRSRTIEDAMNEILRRADLQAIYEKSNPVFARKITLRIDSVPVMQALAKVLGGTGLVARLSSNGETVMVRKGSSPPQDSSEPGKQGSGSLTVRVVDSVSGNVIPGVTIEIKKINLSGTTNSDGLFSSRDIPAGAYSVEVRFFGYKAQSQGVTVETGKLATIHVSLSPSASQLSGVITTAVGTQRRIEVGNDVTVINADSVVKSFPISSVTDILDGRVPGLTVERASGSPGDPAKIRIRGEGSITRSGEPIIIVDGIKINSTETFQKDIAARSGTYNTPSLLDQIDPNSIETIEVQKGPAASALYGSDAANGVIVITTKRGGSGATNFTVRGSEGITYLPGKYPANYFVFAHSYEGWGNSDNTPCVLPCRKGIIDSIVSFQALNDPRYNPFGRGRDSRISTTVSGGKSALGYSLTASTSRTQGYIKLPSIEIDRWAVHQDFPLPKWAKEPERYRDWQLNSGVSLRPNSDLYVSFGLTVSGSQQNRTSGSNLMVNDLRYAWFDTSGLGPNGIFGTGSSPFMRVQSKTSTSRTTGSMNWQPKDWLPLHATVGLDIVNRLDQHLLQQGMDPKVGAVGTATGRFNSGLGNLNTQTFSFGTGGSGIRLPLFNNRSVHLLSGVNLTRTAELMQRVFADSAPMGMYIPPSLNGGSQREDQRIVAGWYIEPKLNLESRFFVAPGLRFDGSNRSGTVAGLSSFPRLSFSWIASEEEMFPFKSWIDLFRVRAALGFAGRLPGSGDHVRLMALQEQMINGVQTEALSVTALGNTRLRPEKSRELEFGFDAEVWRNRLNLNVTYSRGETSDALFNATVAPSVLGSMSQPINIGNVRKHGLEMTIDAQLIDDRMISWNVVTSFSKFSNKVTRLGPDYKSVSATAERPTQFNMLREGYPLDAIWYYPIVGYFDLDQDGLIGSLGELRFSDTAVFVGSGAPKSTSSLSSSIALLNGRINVNGIMKYTSGRLMFSGNGLKRAGVSQGLLGCFHCSSEHSDAIPLYDQAVQLGIGYLPHKVGELSFDALSVSYNLPSFSVARLNVRRTSISLQGNNIAMFTNYRGKDPGVSGIARPRQWKLAALVGN